MVMCTVGTRRQRRSHPSVTIVTDDGARLRLHEEGAMAGPHADIREYLVVHRSLRVTLGRFVDASDRLEPARLAEVVGERWGVLARGLHHHHEVEDTKFFPMIMASRPDTTALIEQLEAEHREL